PVKDAEMTIKMVADGQSASIGLPAPKNCVFRYLLKVLWHPSPVRDQAVCYVFFTSIGYIISHINPRKWLSHFKARSGQLCPHCEIKNDHPNLHFKMVVKSYSLLFYSFCYSGSLHCQFNLLY